MDSSDNDESLDDRLVDDSSKNNASSANYTSNTNISAAVSLCSPSARHVSSHMAETARAILSSPQAVISRVREILNCCVDSGATHHMLNDYACFTSYTRCHNEYVTLGDETRVKIYGRGTARFSLNGQIVEVRDALHVPQLRHPLYSLRVTTSSNGGLWLLLAAWCWFFYFISYICS